MLRTKVKFDSLKSSLASYSPSILFLTSRSSSGSWKGSQDPKWFSMPKKILGFDTTSKSLPCSEPKLQFHSLKSYLASYSTSIQFLTSRWILTCGGDPQWFSISKNLFFHTKCKLLQIKRISKVLRMLCLIYGANVGKAVTEKNYRQRRKHISEV